MQRFGYFLAIYTALYFMQAPAALGQDTKKNESQLDDGKKVVNITVLVPQADAVITVDGVTMKEKGLSRKFVTPKLDVKGAYNYTLVVKWEPNNYTKITRTQKVRVDPSMDTNLKIDMTKQDPRFPDDIVVRFVPTPNEVVDAMCKLANVRKDDVVYDLGCGDGRMVIRAVEKFGAKHGVGVDLDPKLVAESKLNAEKAKVKDRVEFREGDVLKVEDLPDASVVLLYMGNDINLRLRPLLQSKLKPGSRVVSHRFKMGDWEPNVTQTLTVDGEDYEIHLWIIGEEKKKQ